MSRYSVRRPFQAALFVAIALGSWTCGGGGRSPAPGSGTTPGAGIPGAGTTPQPGATRVTGSERLVWTQPGDAANLRFRAYVDGNPVDLSASCLATPDPDCSSPLPPMGNGVHTIALAAVTTSGLEGTLSDAMTVDKVSATGSALTTEAVPDAAPGGGLRFEALVNGPDGQAFAIDAVARALKAPLQLAAIPDGRLLVADGDGRVTMLHPGDPARDGLALDAREFLNRESVGAVGLAVHPDFADNGFVYASLVSPDPSGARLQIVRLREVGDVLGEAAALFDAPLLMAADVSGTASAGTEPQSVNPAMASARLAFGPDGLLYVLLAPGVVFDHELAASRPLASIVRIDDDGRAARAGALPGIGAYPLGLAWHPTTNELLAIFPGPNGTAAIASVEREAAPGVSTTAALAQDPRADGHPFLGRLQFDSADTSGLPLGRAFVDGLGQPRSTTVRLTVPVALDGLLGPLTGDLLDVVAAGGIVYAAVTAHGEPGAPADRSGLVLRLRPR